ncbi:outer membrane beta-barrel protein [Ulvibacterium sp.]|uniref:outer membrane protein n=1 Tax=Ulvibacterium sp. TaxID=2665914 RepID=UPI00261F2EBD|nr:outer membrane beta-barrel protein [Ulvibacterium sp.]
MKSNILLIMGLLALSISYSQEKRWSVETNYTIVPGDGFFGEDDFIDIGVKFRFVRLGIVYLGFGINGGFSRTDVENTGFASRTDDTYLIQPRVFSELRIPGLKRLRPSLGLGASYVNVVTDYTTQNGFDNSDSTEHIGFNLNLGISYDIGKRFFVQAQYDFIDLTPDEDVPDTIVILAPLENGNINNIRLGLGFRF